MKKALMYLLLALGISLVVIFIGGALVGIIAGFIDGFHGNEPGTTSSMNYMFGAGSVTILLLVIILNWVFLKFRFASYTIGRIPKSAGWKVMLGMLLSMAGMAVLYCLMYDASKSYSDPLLYESYAWMRQHPVFSIFLLMIIEATANLVIYGAVLREILEWKHRPTIIISVYAVIMAFFSLLGGTPLLMIPSLLMAQLEGWVYEYTRSVIPVIVGDVSFWIVMLCLMGIPTNGWWFIIAAILILPAIFLALKPMEPYKPID